jgi:hyperosmotically inducible periplasmic protein
MIRKRLMCLLASAALAFVTVACAQSDPGITTAVKAKMAADDTVKSYRIDVDTKDRVVTLNGKVDTEAARERAVQLARGTDGVRDVVDRLTVEPGVTPTTGIDDAAQSKAKEASREAGEKAGQAGEATGDAALTAKVKTKFLADPDVSGLRIDVDTTNNVVTLNGTVRTAAEKQKAVRIARETDGVKSVVDKLKIEPKS